MERQVDKVLAVADDDGEEDVDYEVAASGKAVARMRRPARMLAARRLAKQIRVDMGPVQETEANRLIAHRKILDEMTRLNWRKSHIAENIAVALEFVFIADASDILANAVRATPSAILRNHAASAPMFSRGDPMPLNPLGPRMTNPRPQRRP